MSDKYTDILKYIIAQYGLNIIEDPRRLRSILSDLFSDSKREFNILWTASQAHIPEELLKCSNDNNKEQLIIRLSQRLIEEYDIADAAANWAVNVWAIAMDIIKDEKKVVMSQETLIPVATNYDVMTDSPIMPSVYAQNSKSAISKRRFTFHYILTAGIAIIFVAVMLVIFNLIRNNSRSSENPIVYIPNDSNSGTNIAGHDNKSESNDYENDNSSTTPGANQGSPRKSDTGKIVKDSNEESTAQDASTNAQKEQTNINSSYLKNSEPQRNNKYYTPAANPSIIENESTSEKSKVVMIKPGQLTGSDFEGKTKWELDIMRNEYFARKGYKFYRTDLQNYFLSQPWYHPITNNQNRIWRELSKEERRNILAILRYEDAHGMAK